MSTEKQSVGRAILRLAIILEELKIYYRDVLSKQEDIGDGWVNNGKAEYHKDVADYTEAIRILKSHNKT